jgi:pimeloyl-ACP methyl ester carboxylesterase
MDNNFLHKNLDFVKRNHMVVNCKEEIIEVPGFQIGIKRWGSPDKHPVLAFHGLMDNAASYDFLGPLLSHVHLIAIDSPGCGKSSNYPPGALPQLLEESYLMYHLVDQLGLKKFSLIGHSLGTFTVNIMAVATPERIQKAVFLETLGPPLVYAEKSIEFLRRGLENYLNYESIPHTYYKDLESVVEERMKAAMISYQSAKVLVERGVKKTDRGYVWTYDRRLHAMGANFPYEDQIRDYFKNISVPVCLIRSTDGVKYPPDLFEKRKSYIKDLFFQEIPGGHHIHMDDAKAVAEILRSWL